MRWEGGSVRAEPEIETRTFCLKDSGIGRGRELGRRAADQPCAQEGDAGAGGACGQPFGLVTLFVGVFLLWVLWAAQRGG
jgi:hypothetical protein